MGFRRILHVEPDELSQRTCFASNVRLLEKYELTFDLLRSREADSAGDELAAKCPAVQFILDHCGVPDIAAGAIDPWRRHISEIAKLPNVACKISGVMAYCAPGQANLEAVRPYVEHCLSNSAGIALFGAATGPFARRRATCAPGCR